MKKFCDSCGALLQENSKFCPSCGKSLESHSEENTIKKEDILAEIKCGNCGYIGPGEKARSTWAKVLAWVCVFFAPMITILYFVFTHKYRCPKCKSTFLGVKNKDGVYTAQKGSNTAVIILAIFVVIAIIGILSSIVLASLSTARSKGNDAKTKAQVSGLRASAEIYYDKFGNYSTASDCFSGMFSDVSSGMTTYTDYSGYPTGTNLQCNADELSYAVAANLSDGSYWCADSTGASKKISSQLGYGTTQCPSY